jgi:hypothetical protein
VRDRSARQVQLPRNNSLAAHSRMGDSIIVRIYYGGSHDRNPSDIHNFRLCQKQIPFGPFWLRSSASGPLFLAALNFIRAMVAPNGKLRKSPGLAQRTPNMTCQVCRDGSYRSFSCQLHKTVNCRRRSVACIIASRVSMPLARNCSSAPPASLIGRGASKQWQARDRLFGR